LNYFAVLVFIAAGSFAIAAFIANLKPKKYKIRKIEDIDNVKK